MPLGGAEVVGERRAARARLPTRDRGRRPRSTTTRKPGREKESTERETWCEVERESDTAVVVGTRAGVGMCVKLGAKAIKRYIALMVLIWSRNLTVINKS